MAVVVIMPKQGQSVESCIITELSKREGDTVKKGDILFSYETDKASFEEESPADGTVLALFAGEGDEVPVLDRVMVIGEPGEDISSILAEANVSPSEEKDTGEGPLLENADTAGTSAGEGSRVTGAEKAAFPSGEVGATPGISPGGARFVSPRAKKVAAQNAVDASRLEGTGPGGRVIERDVKQALESRPRMTPLARKLASEQGGELLPVGSGLGGRARASDLAVSGSVPHGKDYEDRKLSNIRKLIARSMHASLQNSAQLTHHLGADARQILELRTETKIAFADGKIDVNVTLNDMVCFAVIKALKKFPNVNSHLLGDTLRVFNKVHLGLAVDTERGLMVPAIPDADDLSIAGLSNRLSAAAAACRAGNVNPDSLSPEAATFTVSNLGNYGVEMFTPVINLPQSAILGVNTILPRPKDIGNGIYAFVPHIGLSLTYDHRSLDGGEATRFLKQVATEIETLQLDI